MSETGSVLDKPGTSQLTLTTYSFVSLATMSGCSMTITRARRKRLLLSPAQALRSTRRLSIYEDMFLSEVLVAYDKLTREASAAR